MDFANLHGHSIYSIRDSICKPKELIAYAKEIGMPAIALTDHGTLSGIVEFYQEAIKQNIKPIVGCEVYMATRSRFDKEKGIDKYYHLTLIAMNNVGWSNLTQLVSESFKEEHFYHKPRIDRELLRKHNAGLICLSGCLASHLSHAILKEKQITFKDEDGDIVEPPKLDCGCSVHTENTKKESFIDIINWYKEVFGDRYYLEIQNHGIPEEDIVRDTILDVAKQVGVKVVATGDTHIVRPQDVKAHNIMLAIRDRKSIYDESFSGYPGVGYSLPDEKYIKERFAMAPEAVSNTMEIAERVNLKFNFGNFKIPRFVNVREEDEMFREKVMQGLISRFGENITPEYIQRAEEEIQTIIQMTFPSYFLIVNDYIAAAKKMGIPVGPGRGSAAGSLVAYALEITDVDPIKYDLSFSRFLNKGRAAIPLINFKEYPIEEWKKQNNKVL